jgi:ribonuclease HI
MNFGTKREKVYAVKVGRNPGIYLSWNKAKPEVIGYPGAVYKSFEDIEDAHAFITGKKRRLLQSQTSAPRTLVAKPAPPETADPPVDVVLFTDGACQNHPVLGAKQRVAGCGVYWGDDHPNNISVVFEDEPITNQRAELKAIMLAIEMFVAKYPSPKKLLIKTDSKYSIDAITKWARGWKANNWLKSDGEDVMNRDIIIPLYELVQKHKGRILFKHVYGHTGVAGNEAADRLAVGALTKYALEAK